MNLYVGTSGYAYREWKGSFYPDTLPAKRMLHYYGEHFRSVEINNTFYRMPTSERLRAWADEVPADFRFALKAPQRITHQRRLVDADEDVGHLLDVAGVLGTRLGALLFQLPPTLKKDVARLDAFLALLPATVRVAFEFRHPSWFDSEVFALLQAHGAALCIAEAEDASDTPVVATADWGYLRLRRADYGDAELQAWAARVRQQGWQDAFVFFKHEDAGRGPQLARRFLELAV
ncbi:MAG: DUF72 domain-containing protein [Betaproteobacteria bacterium]|nr:DUF72 domain-containing protein [Betaproteobacteria bacterium]